MAYNEYGNEYNNNNYPEFATDSWSSYYPGYLDFQSGTGNQPQSQSQSQSQGGEQEMPQNLSSIQTSISTSTSSSTSVSTLTVTQNFDLGQTRQFEQGHSSNSSPPDEDMEATETESMEESAQTQTQEEIQRRHILRGTRRNRSQADPNLSQADLNSAEYWEIAFGLIDEDDDNITVII